MEIRLEEITEENPSLNLKEECDSASSLYEMGCRNEIASTIYAQKTSGGYWMQCKTTGFFNFECRRCGHPLPGPFSLPWKLLVSHREEKGINVPDNDGLDWNEYEVEIGPDVITIPLDDILHELIVLGCNPADPPEELQKSCPSCEKSGDFNYNSTDSKEIDPRWSKLKSLRDRKEP